MTTFKLGKLSIDAVAYGSQGNAILGIRDSGKSYTATFMAERLFESGIPFIAFDPIGVWRFLRVPGKGRGYPIVVAGGKAGDLPLTVAGAPEIVRAAMTNGVSLVIDLFDIHLSKNDWKKIVLNCVQVLLHENSSHGLRHVFIEEASEFCPQRPGPDQAMVYAEIEKLARMGGNSRLGYTLINQRSQEVSKAVLELCENLFLHRQRGKNALENMDKWLAIAGAAEQKEIIKSLPDMPQGECWAWLGGDKPQPPVHIKVPEKNSLHPDRRVMRGDKVLKAQKAVDVGSFVEGMKSVLVEVEAEAKANDPKLLQAEIKNLRAALAKAGKSNLPTKTEAKESRAERAEDYQAGVRAGATHIWSKGAGAIKRSHATLTKDIGVIGEALVEMHKKVCSLRAGLAQLQEEFEKLKPSEAPATPAKKEQHGFQPVPDMPVSIGYVPNITRSPQQRILDAIAWWNAAGIQEPNKPQVAVVALYTPGTGTFAGYLSGLKTAGLITYPSSGRVALTDAGRAQARAPDGNPDHSELMRRISSILDGPQNKIMAPLVQAYPKPLSREDLAEAAGYTPGTGTFAGYVSGLSSIKLVSYPERGKVLAADWLFTS